MENYYAVPCDIQGVGSMQRNGEPYLLDVISGKDYPNLYFLTEKQSEQSLGLVVNDVYPSIEKNNIFVGVNLSPMKGMSFPADMKISGRYTFSFMLIEDEYYLAVLDGGKYHQDVSDYSHVYFYDLDNITGNFITNMYFDNVLKTKVVSRDLNKQLQQIDDEPLYLEEVSLGWQHLGLPVDYVITLAVSIDNINFRWVIFVTTFVSLFLYFILFTYQHFSDKEVLHIIKQLFAGRNKR
jgi:hypothetical protein